MFFQARNNAFLFCKKFLIALMLSFWTFSTWDFLPFNSVFSIAHLDSYDITVQIN